MQQHSLYIQWQEALQRSIQRHSDARDKGEKLKQQCRRLERNRDGKVEFIDQLQVGWIELYLRSTLDCVTVHFLPQGWTWQTGNTSPGFGEGPPCRDYFQAEFRRRAQGEKASWPTNGGMHTVYMNLRAQCFCTIYRMVNIQYIDQFSVAGCISLCTQLVLSTIASVKSLIFAYACIEPIVCVYIIW